MPDRMFQPRQLAKGQAVEMEHTDDPALAREIAKDHLTESEVYYDHLEEMERNMPKVAWFRAKAAATGPMPLHQAVASGVALNRGVPAAPQFMEHALRARGSSLEDVAAWVERNYPHLTTTGLLGNGAESMAFALPNKRVFKLTTGYVPERARSFDLPIYEQAHVPVEAAHGVKIKSLIEPRAQVGVPDYAAIRRIIRQGKREGYIPWDMTQRVHGNLLLRTDQTGLHDGVMRLTDRGAISSRAEIPTVAGGMAAMHHGTDAVLEHIPRTHELASLRLPTLPRVGFLGRLLGRQPAAPGTADRMLGDRERQLLAPLLKTTPESGQQPSIRPGKVAARPSEVLRAAWDGVAGAVRGVESPFRTAWHGATGGAAKDVAFRARQIEELRQDIPKLRGKLERGIAAARTMPDKAPLIGKTLATHRNTLQLYEGLADSMQRANERDQQRYQRYLAPKPPSAWFAPRPAAVAD